MRIWSLLDAYGSFLRPRKPGSACGPFLLARAGLSNLIPFLTFLANFPDAHVAEWRERNAHRHVAAQPLQLDVQLVHVRSQKMGLDVGLPGSVSRSEQPASYGKVSKPPSFESCRGDVAQSVERHSKGHSATLVTWVRITTRKIVLFTPQHKEKFVEKNPSLAICVANAEVSRR